MSGAANSSGGSAEAGGIQQDPEGAALLGRDGVLVLLVRDPTSLYAYWAFGDAPPAAADQSWAVRLYDLTTLNPAAAIEYACPAGLSAGQLTDVSPERRYRAELGFYDQTEAWRPLLRSNALMTPPASPTDWIDDRFATIAWETDLSRVVPLALPTPAPPVSAAPAPGPARREGTLPRKPLPGMMTTARAETATDRHADAGPATDAATASQSTPPAVDVRADGAGLDAGARAALAPGEPGTLGALLAGRLRLRRRHELLPLPAFAPLAAPVTSGSTACGAAPAVGATPGG